MNCVLLTFSLIASYSVTLHELNFEIMLLFDYMQAFFKQVVLEFIILTFGPITENVDDACDSEDNSQWHLHFVLLTFLGLDD